MHFHRKELLAKDTTLFHSLHTSKFYNCLLFCFRISMETAAMGGMAGFQYIAPNHIIKTQLH